MDTKVIKLLQLSRSSNDNEALAAIRKANELVQDWSTAQGNQNPTAWEHLYKISNDYAAFLHNENVSLTAENKRLKKEFDEYKKTHNVSRNEIKAERVAAEQAIRHLKLEQDNLLKERLKLERIGALRKEIATLKKEIDDLKKGKP